MSGHSKHDKERMTAYMKDPWDICIVGGANCPEGGGPNDTDATSGPGYDARILQPLLEVDLLDVERNGIIQAVVLRKNGKRDELQAGRLRVRWARAVQKRTGKPCPVPCIFRQGDDANFRRVMVSENEHRIADTFENKARKVLELVNQGDSDEEIAITMRCTDAAVRNYKKYFDLSKELQDEMRADGITGSAAIQLAALPREEQTAQLQTLKAEAKANGHKKIKVTAAKKAANKAQGIDRLIKVPIRVAKKVIAHEKADELQEGFVLGVRWMMGDLQPEKVKGLKGILKDLFVVDEGA